MQATVFPWIDAAAFIYFVGHLVRRLFEGGVYRAFSSDVTVTWKPYRRPFWCTVEWRLSMRQVAHAKCNPNLTADGLTSQVCSILLPGTCYMWDVSALAASLQTFPYKLLSTCTNGRPYGFHVTVTSHQALFKHWVNNGWQRLSLSSRTQPYF